MRFAGDAIQKYTGDSDVSEYGAAWQRSHQKMQQKPVVPGFNTEDLIETPELPAGHPLFDQNDKSRYIQQQPGSGVAAVPAGLLPKVFVKEAVGGIPTADGTLYKGQPDPFQENNKIRPSDSDDQFMDVMRSGFV